MGQLLQVEFKHNNVFVQASTEPQLKGKWRGLLVGPLDQRAQIDAIVRTLDFKVPYRFGGSMWSTFTINGQEPQAAIDEVLDRMMLCAPDFPLVPYDLVFSVFDNASLIVRFADEDRQVVTVGLYNPVRGRNDAFVARAKAMPEVDDAIDLLDGRTIIVLAQEVSDAATFVGLGQKLTEAYEKKR